MPRISKVTTRRGDSGETNLGDHTRVSKDSDRVEAFGTVDELNSVMGVALALELGDDVRVPLSRIQNELLDVGADLARPTHVGEDSTRRIAAGDVERLEAELARLLAGLAPLKNFVLPGGAQGAAQLHVARSVCRRGERLAVRLARSEPVNPQVLRYLNRLSDLLFVMARVENARTQNPEPTWDPRGTTKMDRMQSTL